MPSRSSSFLSVLRRAASHLEENKYPLRFSSARHDKSSAEDALKPKSEEHGIISQSFALGDSLLCRLRPSPLLMHGRTFDDEYSRDAWRCMGDRRGFAATSRTLKIKQRRAAMAVRVKIPRWMDPSSASEGLPSESLHQSPNHVDVVPHEIDVQRESDADSALNERHDTTIGSGDRGTERPPTDLWSIGLPSATSSDAPPALSQTLTNLGSSSNSHLGVDPNDPRGMPVISADLAAELATSSRHIPMSHLPEGLQRVYEKCLDSKPPSLSCLTVSVALLCVSFIF